MGIKYPIRDWLTHCSHVWHIIWHRQAIPAACATAGWNLQLFLLQHVSYCWFNIFRMVVFASDSNRLVQIFQTCPVIIISIPKRNPKMTTFNTLLDLDYRKKGITFSQAWSHQNLDISLFLGWREACAVHNWKGTQAIPGNKRNKLMRTSGDWGDDAMTLWLLESACFETLRHVFLLISRLCQTWIWEFAWNLELIFDMWLRPELRTLFQHFLFSRWKVTSRFHGGSYSWFGCLESQMPGISGYENEWDLKFPQTRSNKVQRCSTKV